MSDSTHFALVVLLTAAVGLVAVLSNRLTERVKVPVPLLVLVGAAAAARAIPSLQATPEQTVERLVTVALVLILFDGGAQIGLARFRAAAGPILVVGVAGTFLTAAGAALLLHGGFSMSWYLALLVATAVAPTDPAVVFSVLGRREVAGRAGVILQGESGANDPVGISLMTALIAAGGLSGHAWGRVGIEFVLQMGIGGAVGVVGGLGLVWFMRRVPLPSEGLYPLRTLACVLFLFGLATLAHGSGFLAVFVAGIIVGDARAPFKREIERFHAALASLAEIVAFVALGLTVTLSQLGHPNVWVTGLLLWAGMTIVIRPLAVGACLLPAGLPRNERAFVVFAGLKGAVPILLGELLRAAHIPDAERLYGIVVVVVLLSVAVQGGLVPTMARWLHVPMRPREPAPWSLGVRLRDEPERVQRLTVASGAAADGHTIADVADLFGDMWISLVVRDLNLVPVTSNTRLQAGDEVLILAEPEIQPALAELFERPVPPAK